MLRSNPHLIEINTRLWLKEMREKHSSPEMTISSIPDEEWLNLKHLGFDIVWLMGVWTCGKISAEIARKEEFLIEEARKNNMQPEEHIGCSPYSIMEYKLSPGMGFDWELKALKEKLNAFGMKLFLDFVSNHTAIDNVFIDECIDCFVKGSAEDYAKNPEMFYQRELNGEKIYVAYGRDPHFPAWKDTVQLNYFNEKTREKMKRSLLEISELCDGVRCDMVMLTLNDIHESAWSWLLSRDGYKKPEREFWQEAISMVKEQRPEFVFMAEVYWGLEWKLQQMGFDYTYDKVIYDRLKSMGADDVRGHLRAERLYQKRSVRFIDNHDEIPSVVSFGKSKAMAAAVIISTVRGMRFYNDMQLRGIKYKVPLQFLDFDMEKNEDLEMEKFYQKLLKICDHPAFHGGEWNLIEALPSGPEDRSNRNIISFNWVQRRTMKVVVVNYSSEESGGLLNVKIKPKGDSVTLFEEMSDRFFPFKAEQVSDGLRLEKIPPYGFYIFDLEM